MIDVAVLKAMAAAGATVEVVIAAVEAAQLEEQARVEAKRAKDAARQRLSRGHRVTSCDIDGQSVTSRDTPSSSPSPSPPSPITPSPLPPTTPPSTRSLRSRSLDWPADFKDQFWRTYPRKAGKKAAFRKLEGLAYSGEVPFGVLMAGIAKIPINDPQFIPHPATWLNRGGWDDEPLPLGAGTNGSSRRLQDDSLSVSRALRRQREAGGFTVPPRPSLLPTSGGDDLRLLPTGRSTEP